VTIIDTCMSDYQYAFSYGAVPEDYCNDIVINGQVLPEDPSMHRSHLGPWFCITDRVAGADRACWFCGTEMTKTTIARLKEGRVMVGSQMKWWPKGPGEDE
jgi:hypothetical protein